MPLASGQCDTGQELDSDGYHLITCKTGGGWVISHNNMVSAWSDCLSQLQLHHEKNPAEGMLILKMDQTWSATTQKAVATRRER